jgi:DNA polymerase-3 subunit delta'
MPFTGIKGHDNRIALLRRTLASGKIANTYLFEGPEGCGKRMTALAFIEAVFCGKAEGCGRCPSCRKIAGMNHPDLHIVEPDGAFIKIDQIRELQRELALRPYEAAKKGCIIDGAERLNLSSGNALLKTLEEPSGDALIILISANPDGVLPTILSRCQRLSFAPLPETLIETILKDRGTAPEAARIAASLAGGSVKKAIEMGEDTVLETRNSFLERMGNLSLGDISQIFILAEELSGDRDNTLELLVILSSFLRDTLLLRNGSSEIVNTDLLPLARKEAGRFSGDEIMERINHVNGTRRAIMGNVNARLALETMFMRLAN